MAASACSRTSQVRPRMNAVRGSNRFWASCR
jgi:hypothetical protein